MIKFFRKIRQRLLQENRVSKYLVYAVGEIVLVVIGILIALQINNWNEEKKDRKKEYKILKEILVDPQISKSDLENDIYVNKKFINTTENLKKHVFERKPQHDSIVFMFLDVSNITQFSPKTSGYQNLKSEGINLIRNDSLRKEISNLFEIRFPYLVMQGREHNKFNNSKIDLAPYVVKYIDVDMTKTISLNFRDNAFQINTNPPIINDYSKLLNDKSFLSTLQKTIYERGSKVGDYYSGVKHIDRISNLIKNVLNNNFDD